MEDLLSRITINPNICRGKPCIRGMRYPVRVMHEVIDSGMTFEEILDDYPDLERDDLVAVLAYTSLLSRRRPVT